MTEAINLYRRAAQVIKPLKEYAHSCHAASLALVNAGVGTRVARGMCDGVGGQHSWVVVGNDCYNPKALIIDPTLWSYRSDVKRIFVGLPSRFNHRPHGTGSIWDWGKPVSGGGEVIKLRPKFKLSSSALFFLDMLGPLDVQGWMALSSAPVGEWPAAEIFAAMDDTKELNGLVPIDKLGMLTDRNPSGLYLPMSKESESAASTGRK